MEAHINRIRLDNALILVVLVGLSGWFSSCASSKNTGSRSSSSADYNTYNYDLSATRPTFSPSAPVTTKPPATAPPTRPAPENRRPMPMAEPLHINKKLDAILDTISVKNRSIRYAQGYRIQVYVGEERGEMDRVKRFTYQNFPELNPYTTFRQPTYRLKVGDFMRRLDAERYLAQLRQQFSSATLLPDRIEIRRSLSVK
ncbi:SPOR domain-containing protein [Larkinella terrae]|uniref:SPOR domain-containing protein n=1 Tax=Larkinella terrae TaxID=2025311 RepID=A0A7K0EGK4_9BACT|nr:SPOR domain-containing protein [Larkinella terrae]MRS60980.1 SPOR domain-containing protein [Larkinella terrae]